LLGTVAKAVISNQARLRRHSSDATLVLRPDGEPLRACRGHCPVHIQFENATDGNEWLWPVAIFGSHETKCLGTINKQAPAHAALVLHDPVAATVLTDHE